jgi:glucosamine--fructose-6-phosphate aminotransferase (isomerizing)
LPVALAAPSLFTLYSGSPRLSKALVVGISQSGESPDVVSVLAEGKRQGALTLAITNTIPSPLSQAAEFTVDIHAGVEKAVAATKTYTSSLAAMAFFSAHLAADEKRLAELERLPDWMAQTLAPLPPILQRTERYRYMSHCIVIGRGYNYSTAFEIALKIKELTRVVTEPYSSADVRHGPIGMVREGFPVIVIATGGAVYEDMVNLVIDLKKRGAELLIISDDPPLLAEANLALPVPGQIPEWLTPLIAVLPGQLFAHALAQARGLNVDQPQGITKVTETL